MLLPHTPFQRYAQCRTWLTEVVLHNALLRAIVQFYENDGKLPRLEDTKTGIDMF